MLVRCNNNGSALVGVVALAMIVTVAIVGFMQITGSLSRNEKSMLENTQAFWACESGIQLGIKYSKSLNGATFFNQNGGQFKNVRVNDISIDVDITSLPATREIEINAHTSEVLPNCGHPKSLRVRATSNYGKFAHLYGKPHPDNNDPNDPWDWQGWYGSCIFKGPLHMNSRIMLGYSVSNHYIFTGPVTCSRSDYDNTHSDPNYTNRFKNSGGTITPNISGLYNNFDHGIEFGNYRDGWNLNNSHDLLNSIFSGSFLSDQPAVDLPVDLNNKVGRFNASGDKDPTATEVQELPVTKIPGGYSIGDSAHQYRPTLEFSTKNGGSVNYIYFKDGNYKTVSYTVSGKVFYSKTSINVLGVVSGKTAVVTGNGASIIVVADKNNGGRGNNYPGLVYSNYSNNQDGTDPKTSGSDDILGLISGKDIVFNPTWLQVKSGELNKVNIQKQLSNNNYLYVCGALSATETDRSCIRWDVKYRAGYTDNLQTNYFRLCLLGSQALSTYRVADERSTVDHQQYGGIQGHQYVYDSRLGTLCYPNEALASTVDGTLLLTVYGWGEKNN
jgi:hypothetical protein